MMTQCFDHGVLVESYGIDDTTGEWVHVRDGVEIERRPLTPEEEALFAPPADETPTLDSLAAQLMDQQGAIDQLILDSFGV